MGCWIQRIVLETRNDDKCCEVGQSSTKCGFQTKTKERVMAGRGGSLPNMLAGVKGQPPPLVYSCVG